MKSITPPQYHNEAYTLSTDIEASKTITTNNFTVSSSGWAEFSKNIYPIGSVYITFKDIKPANIFGGTWELLKGGIFLCSTTENPGGTGGAETHTHKTKNHTLTIAEIPKHNHEQRVTANLSNDGSAIRMDFVKDAPSNGSKFLTYLQGVNTTETGGDKSHNHGDTESANNLPPYIKVYMWKRTA